MKTEGNHKRTSIVGQFSRLAVCCWLASTIALVGGSAEGEFVKIEDFEGLVLGGIGGQDGWVAGASTVVASDPAGDGNRVLAVTDLGSIVRKDLLLPQGTTRMVFMRFRFAKQLSGSFGLSHASAPTEYSDFGPELSLTSASNDLRIANGATPGIYDKLDEVDVDAWYNVWMLVDNTIDTTRVWLNATPGESATDENALINEDAEDTFGFRTSSSRDIVNFYIKTTSGGSGDFGPLYVDDVYLENSNSLNLTNPVLFPRLAADFDRDGDVDGDDFLAWQGGFGTTVDATLPDGDADADGDVDGDDFLLWQGEFGSAAGASSTAVAVPEPASVLLLIAGCLAWIRFGRSEKN